MNKKDKLDYLNCLVMNKDSVYNGPAILYKYRSFDEFTFDMLENKYVYLCPASKLDDETECITTMTIRDLYNMKRDGLKKQCVFQILSLIKPYTTEENYQQVEAVIYQILNANGTVRPNFLLDSLPELQELVPDFDVVPLFNWLVNIPKQLDKPEIISPVQSFIELAVDAREKIGVCSLSEDENNSDLWDRYGGKGSGYCVEYDMSDYFYTIFLFPVIYEDKRETNIVWSVISSFIGQAIRAISGNQLTPDSSSQHLRLFISKYTEWECQNEWRILGDAGSKIPAPKINRIILGSNVSEDNKKAMIEFCLKNNIHCEYINY